MAIIRHRAIIIIAPAVFMIILAMSCRECPTEPDYDIYLTAEDVFSTSVVLNVILPDSGYVSTFALDRDDSTVATYTCGDDDTLIFDEDLTPNTDYIYRVRFLKDGKTKSESDPITVHTMDTTSHDFTWEIDTLGNYGSYLKDAWIVDENNIWVVGNIETDSETYNAAKWDGKEWTIFRISFYYRSDLISPELYSIYYFSENDIWVTTFGLPVHWDGTTWTLYHIQDMGLDASAGFGIWGTSSSNMYFVGLNGSIVHYDGSTFTKMESPNATKLLEVAGSSDGEYVFAAGYDVVLPTKTTALMIHDGSVEEMYYSDYLVPQTTADYGAISAVDVCGNYAYFVTYKGFWKYNFKHNVSIIEKVFKNYDYSPMIVHAPNDILLIGGGYKYAHFNGSTWDFNNDIYNQYSFADYGADLKGDIAVITGYTKSLSNGIVAIGKR
jgi:hypothetical protein